MFCSSTKKTTTFVPQGLMWLGGNNEFSNGVWVWTDGTPITYTKWAKGQPDGKTPQGAPEHCLVTNFEAKEHWDDDDCTRQRGFVCQYW